MKNINQHYEKLTMTMEQQYDGIIADLKDHIDWLEDKLDHCKNSSGDFDVLKKEYDQLISEHNSLKFKFSQHEEAYDRVLEENRGLKQENKTLKNDIDCATMVGKDWEARFYALKATLPNNGEPVKKENVEKSKGHAKKGGRGKYERKTFVVTCGDCGVLFEAKGGNAKYCPDCRKARIRATSRAWKLKNKKNK